MGFVPYETMFPHRLFNLVNVTSMITIWTNPVTSQGHKHNKIDVLTTSCITGLGIIRNSVELEGGLND